jgi:hypothetical protein
MRSVHNIFFMILQDSHKEGIQDSHKEGNGYNL